MNDLIVFLLGTIKDAPGYFILTIVFVMAILYIHSKARAINLEEISSIGAMQSDQVSQLLISVSQLSKDLAEARKEISRLYHKISELEDTIRLYRAKLRDIDIEIVQEVLISDTDKD